jgi:hypothetical protein
MIFNFVKNFLQVCSLILFLGVGYGQLAKDVLPSPHPSPALHPLLELQK